jgi:hypothetical protein
MRERTKLILLGIFVILTYIPVMSYFISIGR